MLRLGLNDPLVRNKKTEEDESFPISKYSKSLHLKNNFATHMKDIDPKFFKESIKLIIANK